MATPNYSFEKRQRELAKKRKKEDKAARKALGLPPEPEDGKAEAGAEGAAAEGGAPAAEGGSPAP